jgi:CRP-like cAMP-binding protein
VGRNGADEIHGAELTPLPALPCSACPLRRLSTFRAFEGDELAFIEKFKVGEMSVKAGSNVFLEGHDSAHLYTVLDGWAVRYKLMENGRRQIFNFAIRGDFLGIQGVLFDKMLHSVEALSDLRLCVFSRARIWELYERHSGLAFDLTWIAAREESILADHLAAVGQKPARERIAYALVYLFDRARRAGMLEGASLRIPVTQEHLADTMGLSLVHTNKTIQRLRSSGWLEWSRQKMTLHDEARLAELAGYDRYERRPTPFI